MTSFTENEKKALLILLKDFTTSYNANSLRSVVDLSSVGTQKLLKRLEGKGLVTSQRIGKAIIYKARLGDDYTKEVLAFLLADEANHFKLWKEEFRSLYRKGRIVMLFGSATRNYDKARDIDVLIADPGRNAQIRTQLAKKADVLPKPLQALHLTIKEFEESVRSKDRRVLEIVRTGIVLYGYAEYVEVLHVASS